MKEPLAFGIDHLSGCEGECPTCVYHSLIDPKKATVDRLIARFNDVPSLPSVLSEEVLFLGIEELGLKPNTKKVLEDYYIHVLSVISLLHLTVGELNKVHRFGPVCFTDLFAQLKKVGAIPESVTWSKAPEHRRLRDLT